MLATSALDLWRIHPPLEFWALVALTLFSGSAVLKIPSVAVNFSISDVFTLTTAVVFGPAAGTVTVAIDSLAISARLVRSGLPLERVLFNAAAPPVAMWLSAGAFFRVGGIQPLYVHPLGLEVVGPWLLLFAALYFFLNTCSVALAIALHERVSVIGIWRAHFQNLWLTFVGGALGTAFVVFALQHGTNSVVVLSLLLLLALILHFGYRNATGRVADQLSHLAQVNRLHLSTIEALAHAIDAKDGVTHDHIRRVQSRAVELAARAGVDDEQQLRAIETAALLHDVGKLAIPEHILNKPGKLTSSEFDRMKSHARVGAEILSEVDFPYPVVPIVRHHHENWDGTGYPDGLKGTDIPVGARVLAVVDCFDALTSNRPYRRALSARDALRIIEAQRGRMYDPAVVDAFREMCASHPVPEAPVDDGIEIRDAHITSVSVPSASTSADASDEIRIAMSVGAILSTGGAGRCGWSALAEALSELPNVDTVAVFVVNEGEGRLTPLEVVGRHARCFRQLSIPIGGRMSGWVAAAARPMINGDAALDLFDAQAESLRSAAAFPCRMPNESRAVVALYSTRRRAFAPTHQRVVEAAASMLARQATTPRAGAAIRQNRRSAPWPEHFPRDAWRTWDDPAPVRTPHRASRSATTVRKNREASVI